METDNEAKNIIRLRKCGLRRDSVRVVTLTIRPSADRSFQAFCGAPQIDLCEPFALNHLLEMVRTLQRLAYSEHCGRVDVRAYFGLPSRSNGLLEFTSSASLQTRKIRGRAFLLERKTAFLWCYSETPQFTNGRHGKQ